MHSLVNELKRNKLFVWLVFPDGGKLCKQKRHLILSLLSQECYISSNYTESCGKVIKSLTALGKCWVRMLVWRTALRANFSRDIYQLRQENSQIIIIFFFFFFFHWHYSHCGLWPVQQCPSLFFLSATNALHLLTPITWRCLSIFSWVFLFVSSLPVLGWISFWTSYPPPFSLGDLTRLSFSLLSILLWKFPIISLRQIGGAFNRTAYNET